MASQSGDIQGLSKSVESMQLQSSPQLNRIYENVTTSKHTASDQSPPYRTEMSLVLSYDGNKSKYSTSQNSTKSQGSDQSPPPSIPKAMKLLPNKLQYAGKSDLFKSTTSGSPEVEQSINVENTANEEILSKSAVNSVAESNDSNSSKKNSPGKTEKVTKNGESKVNGGNNEENNKKTYRNSNDSQESVRKIFNFNEFCT